MLKGKLEEALWACIPDGLYSVPRAPILYPMPSLCSTPWGDDGNEHAPTSEL